ncbi:MAG: STAS domain-containing protein [Candidatus Polarisedimenticolaceae bacterium]|nr:STAS domain-containing protein [Candidatus Polarisedimenticolaceae bacterium]
MSRATFNDSGNGRLTIQGEFGFATASDLLAQGEKLINQGQDLTIDLSGVTGSDSAGLAVMLEWMDQFRAAGQQLHFLNVPESLLEIARVSNLADLLPLAEN